MRRHARAIFCLHCLFAAGSLSSLYNEGPYIIFCLHCLFAAGSLSCCWLVVFAFRFVESLFHAGHHQFLQEDGRQEMGAQAQPAQ